MGFCLQALSLGFGKSMRHTDVELLSLGFGNWGFRFGMRVESLTFPILETGEWFKT